METSHNHIFVLPRSSPTAFLLKTHATFSATQQTETSAAHRHLRHLATAISPELSKVVCEGLTPNIVTRANSTCSFNPFSRRSAQCHETFFQDHRQRLLKVSYVLGLFGRPGALGIPKEWEGMSRKQFPWTRMPSLISRRVLAGLYIDR